MRPASMHCWPAFERVRVMVLSFTASCFVLSVSCVSPIMAKQSGARKRFGVRSRPTGPADCRGRGQPAAQRMLLCSVLLSFGAFAAKVRDAQHQGILCAKTVGMSINESTVETAALEWFEDLGSVISTQSIIT